MGPNAPFYYLHDLGFVCPCGMYVEWAVEKQHMHKMSVEGRRTLRWMCAKTKKELESSTFGNI